MITLAAVVVWVLAAVLAGLAAVVLLECGAALLPRRSPAAVDTRETLAVLVPAHDEAAGIGATLDAVQEQLRPGERVLVVADRCSDDTAAIARRHGADVLVREDRERRGKGHALAAGLEHLAASPPDLVAFLDADCVPEAGALERLRSAAVESRRPCQAVYVLDLEDPRDSLAAISWLAFLLKNHVRPRGLQRLGLPCLLTGTGMVIPWAALRTVSTASSHLVEDLQLSVDLALAGHPPCRCEEARVRALPAPTASARRTQRQRWEHGHLQVLLTQVPRLWAAALRHGRGDLVALSLEIAVPPLAFLVLALAGVTALAVPLSLAGPSLDPLPLVLAAWACLGAAILATWTAFARRQVPFTTLLSVPRYVLWKVPVYWRFLWRRERQWVRTPRSEEAPRNEGE